MANGGIIGPVQTAVSSPVSVKISTFNSSGTFTAQATTSSNFLIVAGGGGGASGGGGAGGYRASGFGPCALRASATPIVRGVAYTVTVGAGGAGETTGTDATRASNSVFGCITSTGGGGGIAWNTDGASCSPGGSGGGYGARQPGCGGTATTTNCIAQGSAGGNVANQAGCSGGAGGGGVTAVGENSPGGAGADGGAGAPNTITGSDVTYGGGGGGGGRNPGSSAGCGGSGGGGNGRADNGTAVAGTANTGGGGGGGGYTSSGNAYGTGNAGGSGKVVIKEPAANIILAPGVWNISDIYDNVKAGTWTNAGR